MRKEFKMPWDYKSFMKHKQGMSIGQAKKGARMANDILASCLKEGKEQKECERIAIATTLKNITRGGRRIK